MRNQSPIRQSPIPVRSSITLLAAAAVLLAPITNGQVPTDPGSKAIPLSKVERKNKAPVSDDILRATRNRLGE